MTKEFKTKDGFNCVIDVDKFKKDTKINDINLLFSSSTFLELRRDYDFDLSKYLHNENGFAITTDRQNGGICALNGELLDPHNPEHKILIEEIKNKMKGQKSDEGST